MTHIQKGLNRNYKNYQLMSNKNNQIPNDSTEIKKLEIEKNERRSKKRKQIINHQFMRKKIRKITTIRDRKITEADKKRKQRKIFKKLP